MVNRKYTYIAGDWDHDKNAIDLLYKWKKSHYWSLDFIDAHEYTQARDSSLNCNIKSSLKERLNISKTFILVVGEYTNKVTAGSCQYCHSNNSYGRYCVKGYHLDYRSYIEFECEEAIKANMNILVIYNSTKVNKSWCPEIMRDKGIHLKLYQTYSTDNYQRIKNIIEYFNT